MFCNKDLRIYVGNAISCVLYAIVILKRQLRLGKQFREGKMMIEVSAPAARLSLQPDKGS